MITKDKFVYYINKIKDVCDMYNEFDDIARKHNINYFYMPESVLVDISISILEDLADDKDDWIGWWCFENDFGAGDLAAYDENEKEHIIETPEELYDFMFGGDNAC